jgi:uncharacterized membrane protein
MKKLMLLTFLFAFLFAGQANASVTAVNNLKKSETVTIVKHNNFFAKVKDQVKEKVTQGIDKFKSIKKALKTAGLYKALIFMVVGILLILLGSINSIILYVGVIFFLIGAVFLLLDLL